MTTTLLANGAALLGDVVVEHPHQALPAGSARAFVVDVAVSERGAVGGVTPASR